MIAHRHLPTVCVLFGLALVPTLIHSYGGARAEDGVRRIAISTALQGYVSQATGRNATWGQRRFGSDDWIERTYSNGQRTLQLTVVRSYDPKSLYHHPELAIDDDTAFSGVQTTSMPHRPEIPVHVLTPAENVDAVGAYVLRYGQRFVDNPILFQLRTAVELLVSPRQPMTLWFVLERNPAGDRSAGTNLLLAAVDDLRAQSSERD